MKIVCLGSGSAGRSGEGMGSAVVDARAKSAGFRAAWGWTTSGVELLRRSPNIRANSEIRNRIVVRSRARSLRLPPFYWFRGPRYVGQDLPDGGRSCSVARACADSCQCSERLWVWRLGSHPSASRGAWAPPPPGGPLAGCPGGRCPVWWLLRFAQATRLLGRLWAGDWRRAGGWSCGIDAFIRLEAENR